MRKQKPKPTFKSKADEATLSVDRRARYVCFIIRYTSRVAREGAKKDTTTDGISPSGSVGYCESF